MGLYEKEEKENITFRRRQSKNKNDLRKCKRSLSIYGYRGNDDVYSKMFLKLQQQQQQQQQQLHYSVTISIHDVTDKIKVNNKKLMK